MHQILITLDFFYIWAMPLVLKAVESSPHSRREATCKTIGYLADYRQILVLGLGRASERQGSLFWVCLVVPNYCRQLIVLHADAQVDSSVQFLTHLNALPTIHTALCQGGEEIVGGI